ncbi:MAG: methyltransferase domain-containing protein [Betaproteobacteria bacterium]|nr:methyltransferase domain-containing protein [Betaproteobacteria bacterium]
MDVQRIKRKYRHTAWLYDGLIAPATDRLRREAVARLGLRTGDRVLDLGCGTGLSIPLLRQAVGDAGTVYGIEVSPDMLAIARRKATDGTWQNVRLFEADAETFELEELLDGMLCFYVHDITMSSTALPHAMKFLKPAGRLVAAGGKLARGWRGWLINPVTVAYALPFITTFDRSRPPFTIVLELIPECYVEERLLGSQYLAWGTRPR